MMQQKRGIWLIALVAIVGVLLVLAWLLATTKPTADHQATPASSALATATRRPPYPITPTAAGFVVVGGGTVATPATPDEQPTLPSEGALNPAPTIEQPTTVVAADDTSTAQPSDAPPQSLPNGSNFAPTPIPFAGGEGGGSWHVDGDSTTYAPPAGGQAGDALGLIAQLPPAVSGSMYTIAVSIMSRYGEDCGVAVGNLGNFTLVRLRGAKTATYVRLDRWQGEGNFTPLGDDMRVDSAYIGTPHQLIVTLADTVAARLDDTDVATALLPVGSDVLLYAGGEGCEFRNIEVNNK